MQTDAEEDVAHMRAALGLGRRGLGATWPNPSVGCVVVREGRVVGRGRTATGGRPHAETEALAMAGPASRGATAYVTLEPCAHHGRTPPCADALIAAGIARVVVAARDPDPRTDGGGLARLRAAGIAVTSGLLRAEAERDLAGYLSARRQGRPLVTLKLASTLDGRIATAAGESRWITGAQARRAVHAMRGDHDAVMVGVGTALADDPDLSDRLPGHPGRAPVRVVADSAARLPPAARMFAAPGEVWLLHRPGAAAPAAARGFAVAGAAGGIDLAAALLALGAAGLTSVLVEGGAGLAAGLLRAGLVDRLAWFHAPSLLGAEALAAAGPLGITALAARPRFRRTGMRAIGEDMLSEFARMEEEDTCSPGS